MSATRRRLFGLLAAAPLVPVVGAAAAPAYATGGRVWVEPYFIGEVARKSIVPKVGRSKKRRRRTAIEDAEWVGEIARTLGIAWEDGPDFDKTRMYPSDAELAATLGIREGA